MAVFGPTVINDQTVGGSNRLGGKLAVGAVLAQGNTYRERIRVGGNILSIDVRAKMAVSGGTPTVQLVPSTATIYGNDLTVSDVTTGLTTATNLVNATEANHAYTPKGENFIDVVVDTTGGSAAGTITYIDVNSRIQ